MEITARNVNQAFSDIFWRLKTGRYEPEQTRNGPALVIPEPVITTYLYPQERVLFHKGRDANPIFHCLEAIWMLAGRRDVAFLQMFNSKIGQYSDDGKLFNAAYGYRWRKHFGFDQLESVIQILRKDPKTRQAVIQMWDQDDLVKKTKDKACLSANTRFSSPEEQHSIKVLARMFKDGSITRYPVYGVDIATGETKLTWMTDAWLVGKKKTIKLIGVNGEVLTCTSDHKIWVRRSIFKGQSRTVTLVEVEAGSIQAGDVILSVKFGVTGNYKYFKKNTFKNTSYENLMFEHKTYADLLFGCDMADLNVHHMDENTLRNHQNNLCLMTSSGHSGFHRLNNNPMKNISEELKKFKGEERRKVLLSRGSYKAKSVKSGKISESITEPLAKQIIIACVEEGKEEDVYDFTVPETHNAATLDGFVVHNCNTQVVFDTRGNRLNMTVFNRSNDIWYGAYGANAVHFSMLQEFVSSAINMRIGHYRQISNNLHLYTELYDAKRYVDHPPNYPEYDLYSQGDARTSPMMIDADYKRFLSECETFCCEPYNEKIKYHNPFFTYVAQPMAMVSRVRKSGAGDGRGYASKIRAEDWRKAVMMWINNRELAKAERETS